MTPRLMVARMRLRLLPLLLDLSKRLPPQREKQMRVRVRSRQLLMMGQRQSSTPF